jgi:hypothetical protein
MCFGFVCFFAPVPKENQERRERKKAHLLLLQTRKRTRGESEKKKPKRLLFFLVPLSIIVPSLCGKTSFGWRSVVHVILVFVFASLCGELFCLQSS